MVRPTFYALLNFFVWLLYNSPSTMLFRISRNPKTLLLVSCELAWVHSRENMDFEVKSQGPRTWQINRPFCLAGFHHRGHLRSQSPKITVPFFKSVSIHENFLKFLHELMRNKILHPVRFEPTITDSTVQGPIH